MLSARPCSIRKNAPAVAADDPEARPTGLGVDMPESIRADLRANTHVLYRFYTESGELLYVGITNDPQRRFSDHGAEKPWWRRVAQIKIERFRTRRELAGAEIKAIETERPRYNRAYSAGAAQEIRIHRNRGTSLCPDANRFGNEPPRHHPDEPQEPRRLQRRLPCPDCGQLFSVVQDADEKWQPIGDIYCKDCGGRWTEQEWRRAAIGF